MITQKCIFCDADIYDSYAFSLSSTLPNQNQPVNGIMAGPAGLSDLCSLNLRETLNSTDRYRELGGEYVQLQVLCRQLNWRQELDSPEFFGHGSAGLGRCI